MSNPARQNLQDPRLGALRSQSELLERRPFVPHRLLRGPHLQTVIAARLPRKFPWGWKESSEQVFELSDGARVRVTLIDGPADAPVLVGLHGLGGSSESNNMQGLSHKAYREGWSAALFNLYDLNLGGRRPTLFHAGASPQVAELLESVRQVRPWDRYFLAGISLGGNMLLKLLGEWGDDPPEWVTGAAVVSPLVDMTVSWQIIEQPSNTIYRLHFIRQLQIRLRKRARELEGFLDVQRLRTIRSIREFDECVTVPLGGYRDAFDYYRRGSSAPLLERIRVPTLVLHARDDPLLPYEPWTRPEAQSNPFLLPHLTERGGHVGFIEHERRDIDRSWAENRMIDFLRMLV